MYVLLYLVLVCYYYTFFSILLINRDELNSLINYSFSSIDYNIDFILSNQKEEYNLAINKLIDKLEISSSCCMDLLEFIVLSIHFMKLEIYNLAYELFYIGYLNYLGSDLFNIKLLSILLDNVESNFIIMN